MLNRRYQLELRQAVDNYLDKGWTIRRGKQLTLVRGRSAITLRNKMLILSRIEPRDTKQ